MERPVVYLDPSFGEEKLERLIIAFERKDIDEDPSEKKPLTARVGLSSYSGKQNEFFVLNEFGSKESLEVEAKGGNIIGLPIAWKAIRDALPRGREASKEIVLPVLGRPVCCRCFEGVSVFAAGLIKSETDLIAFQVTRMAGDMTKKLTGGVGFVIAKNVTSSAYKAAVAMKRPVLRQEWIHDCWDQHQLLSCVEYQLPPFAGLIVCLTEITDERVEIVHQLVANGGISSADLTKKCTHLIAGSSRSAKYVRAKSWLDSGESQVRIVNTSWFHQSLKAGVCLPETSFPVIDEQDDGVPSEELPNTLGSVPAKPATANFLCEPRAARFPSTGHLRADGVDCHKDKDQDEGYGDMYLSALRLHIIGSDDTEHRKAINCIRDGGGTRYLDFNPTVTHVIVGNASEREVTKIRQMTSSFTYFVTPLWLQECSEAHKVIPVEDRHVFKSQLPLGSNQGRAQRATRTAGPAEDEDCLAEPGSMAQEAHEPSPAGNVGVEMAAANLETSALHKRKSSAPPKVVPGMEQEVDQHGFRKRGAAPIFANKSFVLSKAVCNKEMTETIEGAGGHVMDESERSTISPPDYMVVGHGEQTNSDKMLSCQIVSTHWVHHCLEMEKLEDPDGHILFRPLTCSIPLPGFDSLAICISQYSDVQRTLVRNLCHALGTKFTQKFSKRVTHLLCLVGEGQKYSKALEWGCKVATVEWLFACVRQNFVVDADGFPPRELTAAERASGDLPTTQFPPQLTLPPRATPSEISSQPAATQLGGKSRRGKGPTQLSGKSGANPMRVFAPPGALDPWDQHASQWGAGGSSQSAPATQITSRTRNGSLRAKEAKEALSGPPSHATESLPGPPSQERKVLTRASSRKVPEDPNSQKERPESARQQSQARAAEENTGASAGAAAAENREALIGVLRRRLGAPNRGEEAGPPPDHEEDSAAPSDEPEVAERDWERTARHAAVSGLGGRSHGSFRESGRAERDESQPDVAAAIEGLLAKTNKGKLPDTGPSMEADHGLMSPEPSGISRRRSIYPSDHKRQRLTPGWISRDIDSQTASEEVQTKRRGGPEDDSGNILESQFESQMVGYDDVQLGRQQMLENAKSMRRRPNNVSKGGRRGGHGDAQEGAGGYKMFAGLLRAAEANK